MYLMDSNRTCIRGPWAAVASVALCEDNHQAYVRGWRLIVGQKCASEVLNDKTLYVMRRSRTGLRPESKTGASRILMANCHGRQSGRIM